MHLRYVSSVMGLHFHKLVLDSELMLPFHNARYFFMVYGMLHNNESQSVTDRKVWNMRYSFYPRNNVMRITNLNIAVEKFRAAALSSIIVSP